MQTIITPITTIANTGAVGSGTDVSGINFYGDWTLYVRVKSFSVVNPGYQVGARLVVESTLNNFSTVVPVLVFDFAPASGDLGPNAAEVTYSVRRYQLPLTTLGVSGCLLRSNCYIMLPSSGSSLTFEVWVDWAAVPVEP